MQRLCLAYKKRLKGKARRKWITDLRRGHRIHKNGFTWKDLHELYTLAGGVCGYCGLLVGPFALTVDHKQPIALGGTSNVFNIELCCKPCNQQKRDRPLDEFIELRKKNKLSLHPQWGEQLCVICQ